MVDNVDNMSNVEYMKDTKEMKNARAGLEKLLEELKNPNPVLQEAFITLYKIYERHNPVGALDILAKYSKVVASWEENYSAKED